MFRKYKIVKFRNQESYYRGGSSLSDIFDLLLSIEYFFLCSQQFSIYCHYKTVILIIPVNQKSIVITAINI
jgi:hypothetical protein